MNRYRIPSDGTVTLSSVPNPAYQRGAARERKIAERYRAAGWVVVRAAGSKGPGDLVVGRSGLRTRIIEVKTTKAGPWADFGPAARRRMSVEAERAGWEPILAWWPPGESDPTYIAEGGWPR